MLHRLTYYTIDTDTGRSVRKTTPWHPNKELLEHISAKFYSGLHVKFESINIAYIAQANKSYIVIEAIPLPEQMEAFSFNFVPSERVPENLNKLNIISGNNEPSNFKTSFSKDIPSGGDFDIDVSMLSDILGDEDEVSLDDLSSKLDESLNTSEASSLASS